MQEGIPGKKNSKYKVSEVIRYPIPWGPAREQERESVGNEFGSVVGN